MKRISVMLLLAVLFGACSPLMRGKASYEMDSLYGHHDKQQMQLELQRQIDAAEAEREKRKAQWAKQLGIDPAQANAIENQAVLAYNTPYGERLRALSADEYHRPSSYYKMGGEAQLEALAEYDPDLYIATIGNDGQVHVEPRYTHSTYGYWGNPAFSRPTWYYGYSYYGSWSYGGYYDPFYWDYNPFYWGYNPHYHHYNPYYYPYYRPNYYPYYYRPIHYGRPYKAPTIVRSPAGYNRGEKQRSGATVGTSTSSRYNRGGTSSSSNYRPSSSGSSYRTSPSSGSSSGSSSVTRSSSPVRR